jgi:hypothetical protein
MLAVKQSRDEHAAQRYKKSADNPSGQFHAARHRDRRTFRQRIASLHCPGLANIVPDSGFDKPGRLGVSCARFAKR